MRNHASQPKPPYELARRLLFLALNRPSQGLRSFRLPLAESWCLLLQPEALEVPAQERPVREPRRPSDRRQINHQARRRLPKSTLTATTLLNRKYH
jgi:hypothetical protein